MKYLLPLLFIFGCEGWGVFKHDHEGSCRAGGSYNGTHYVCYENYSELDCVFEGYEWAEFTCEEYCDYIPGITLVDYECEINNDSP